MSYHIHITSVAQQDLIKAADHLEYVLKNPKAADDLLKEAEKQINNLSNFPEKHQIINESVLSSWGIRFVVINNYLAFYTIDSDKNLVIILRFLFQKSNWSAILHHSLPNQAIHNLVHEHDSKCHSDLPLLHLTVS